MSEHNLQTCEGVGKCHCECRAALTVAKDEADKYHQLLCAEIERTKELSRRVRQLCGVMR